MKIKITSKIMLHAIFSSEHKIIIIFIPVIESGLQNEVISKISNFQLIQFHIRIAILYLREIILSVCFNIFFLASKEN